jgi:hypothetical protein
VPIKEKEVQLEMSILIGGGFKSEIVEIPDEEIGNRTGELLERFLNERYVEWVQKNAVCTIDIVIPPANAVKYKYGDDNTAPDTF